MKHASATIFFDMRKGSMLLQLLIDVIFHLERLSTIYSSVSS